VRATPVPPATAIREAAEETGLDPAGVEPLILLARLHIAPSRFDVTGVLAHWRTPSPLSAIDAGETNRVMRVPFTELGDPEDRIMLSTSLGSARRSFSMAQSCGDTPARSSLRCSASEVGSWPQVACSPVDLDQAWRRAG
jgi:hypothetical protein